MNDYGFDYMNYITNIPNNMKYNQMKTDMNFSMAKPNLGNIMTNMMKKDQPIDPTQGWLKGNLFANLYEPYKNFKPAKLDPKNEREALLFQVMQYKFALIELNLYLDTHPNDTEMIRLYNKYQQQANEMIRAYEQKYGPIMQNSLSEDNNFSWETYSWPWEMGEE